MQSEEIKQMINSFPRWHYQFDLKGNLTPIHDKTRINRHRQRKKYFWDPLVDLLGGSLTGKRVLDLGCNAGFWSLCAIENGCDFVLGIDGRQMHVDQANFVFEVKGIKESKYEFVAGNIYDFDFQQFGDFDIVLCLGLLYHISKPMILMEKINQVNSDVLMIDTRLSRIPGSCFEVCHEVLADPRHAVDYELVMVPTKQAVIDLAEQFGYTVAVLKPQFKDYTGCESYQLGTRRAFLCAKKTDLSDLPTEVETTDLEAKTISDIDTSARVIDQLTGWVRRNLGNLGRYASQTMETWLPRLKWLG